MRQVELAAAHHLLTYSSPYFIVKTVYNYGLRAVMGWGWGSFYIRDYSRNPFVSILDRENQGELQVKSYWYFPFYWVVGLFRDTRGLCRVQNTCALPAEKPQINYHPLTKFPPPPPNVHQQIPRSEFLIVLVTS